MKSTIKEIEERFDQDVERFSNLDSGQQTTIDAMINMELITDLIAQMYPNLGAVLDIGCGAGNYDVKLMEKVFVNPAFHLVDLSMPMLNKAKERISPLTEGEVEVFKGDFRSLELPKNHYDVIIATAVLHHLRDDQDWEFAFNKLYELLKPGGSIWIFDLVCQSQPGIQEYIYEKQYGDYLISLKDEAYRDHVFSYIEQEDSPRPLMYQLELLIKTGFHSVDILHKRLNFASFVGFK